MNKGLKNHNHCNVDGRHSTFNPRSRITLLHALRCAPVDDGVHSSFTTRYSTPCLSKTVTVPSVYMPARFVHSAMRQSASSPTLSNAAAMTFYTLFVHPIPFRFFHVQIRSPPLSPTPLALERNHDTPNRPALLFCESPYPAFLSWLMKPSPVVHDPARSKAWSLQRL